MGRCAPPSRPTTDPAELLALARAARDMNGLDLAREVTCARTLPLDRGAGLVAARRPTNGRNP
jgi:hypothetical protein